MRTLLLASFLGLLLTLSLEPAASQRFECHVCALKKDCETSTKTIMHCPNDWGCFKLTDNGKAKAKGCAPKRENFNCNGNKNKDETSTCFCDTSLCNAGRRSIGTGMGETIIFTGLGVLLAQRLWQ